MRQAKSLKGLGQAMLPGACLLMAAGAVAQPVDLPIPAATTDQFPAGVHVRRLATGAVYVNDQGRVLYGLDMRTLLRSGPDPAQYCTAACATTWAPLLAPAGSAPNISFPRHYGQGVMLAASAGAARAAPDWTIIAGPQGPQWVYKSWHLVFVRRGDRPGSTAFDGADGLTWNTLKYLPPVPALTAPANVRAIAAKDGAAKNGYVLADKSGRALFTGACGKSCAGWQPLAAGMASAPIGEWSVGTAGDRPQWLWRGQPVFVSQEDDPQQVPPAGKVLRP